MTGSTVKTFDQLVEKIKASEKPYDLEKISQAYKVAEKAHEGQKRTSGDPYITHPLAVAAILLDYCMDTDTICAALLHDTVEDTDVTLDDLRKKFGEDVALMVDGVTKIGLVPLVSKEEQQAENIRKILMAMSKDIRVIIIKLADRLHNMRTLEARPPEKQRKTSLETMNFYAPIAHRLGMSDVKEEMEDIAIHYLDPYGCKEVEEQIALHKEERDAFIESIKQRIRERISDIKPEPIIEGRVKSIYSIYKKVYVKNTRVDEIYDIYAVRVIVQSVIECYNVLGIIHDMFRPIPYRFKDYIATPKPNRYQSLHTTVIGREGIPFEVQIRTVEMHNTAQYGVAAHWKYKAGISGNVTGEKRFDWIRQLLERQQEADDVEAIADAIKTDLAPDEVFAFTPKGDVISLPVGATVLDFAYSIAGFHRVRFNVFRQRGTYAVALRILSFEIPEAKRLGIPPSVVDLTNRKRGLVLVTGPTGSGKSTTLASLIHIISETYAKTIITLEDPIEYLHPHSKSIVLQREIGYDSKSYASALRAALREDPDVILVGEMRDLETISIAITAAETGHLVFSTLHTNSAAATIDRVIDVFPPHQQQQTRIQLSGVIEGIIAQQLLPKEGGGRVAAYEVMLATPAIRNLIREGKSFQIQSMIQTSKKLGMQAMDDAIYDLYMQNKISAEDAVSFAQEPAVMQQKVTLF